MSKLAFNTNPSSLTLDVGIIHLYGLLVAAMAFGRVVSFTYDGKDRIIEVHAIGVSSKDGGLVVRGYQVDGDSSRPLPAWALFRLDGIDRDSIGFGGESNAPAAGYNMGDRQMQPVLCELDVS